MAVRAENMSFENMGFGTFNEDWVMGNEDGFWVQEQHPFLDSSEQNLASSSSSSSGPFSCSGPLSSEFVQSLVSELEKQRLEMDLFLQLENQRFRKSIMQQESRHLATLLEKYESRIQTLLLRKDEELTAARNKTQELHEFCTRLENEAKAWEKKAKEKEAIALDLHNRLNRVKDYCSFPNAAQDDDDQDAVSFTGSSSSSSTKDQRTDCKLCEARETCVVFFPCRHLCCCMSCEGLLGHCPVCGSVKEASLEVLLV